MWIVYFFADNFTVILEYWFSTLVSLCFICFSGENTFFRHLATFKNHNIYNISIWSVSEWEFKENQNAQNHESQLIISSFAILRN